MPRNPSRDLRCPCARRPLLAKYGLDDGGRPFIHVKVFKQSRVYAELVFTSGKVRIRCRECLKWNSVTIRSPEGVSLRREPLPVSVNLPD